MKIRARFAALLALLALSVLAGPVRAETFWAVSGKKLVAISIDLQSIVAEPVLQVIGPNDLEILAAATQPATGDLWTVFRNIATTQTYLGTWAPGAARPTTVTTTPVLPKDLEFSPGGVLYAVGNDQQGHDYVGTIDLATGALTQLLSVPYPAERMNGLKFHPTDGKLYFVGADSCNTGCVYFIDSLTLPGLQRTRLWSSTGASADTRVSDPFFDSAGNLLAAGTRPGSGHVDGNGFAYYRPTAQGFVKVGNYPAYLTPTGDTRLLVHQFSPAQGARGCFPTATRACQQNRRFEIDVTYDATVLGGSAGTATPSLESDQSLKFSFFDPTNLELFLKVIDGCSYNGHYWIFVSGLTNAGVELVVTDTVTNAVYSYDNPGGQAFAPRLDIEALACN